MTIQDSTVAGNMITGTGIARGAGLYVDGSVIGGTVTIERSTISGNQALAGHVDGGGFVYNANELTVSESTISGNTAVAGGGLTAVYVPTTIENSTISGNSATGTGVVNGYGGFFGYASVLNGGSLTVRSSTVANNNAAAGDAGGIYWYGPSPATLSNTIVADNTAPSAPDVFGAFNVAFSLVESTSGGVLNTTVPGSNLFGIDPLLDPLASNGGPTQTHELMPTSPVIDCGSTGGLVTDQRGAGFPRPIEQPRTNSTAAGADGADIGAFELQTAEGTATGACANNAPTPPAGAVIQPTPAPPTFNLKAAIKKCKKKFRKGPKRAKCIKKAKAKARA